MLRPSRVRREVCSGHRLRLRDVQHYSLLLSIIKSRWRALTHDVRQFSRVLSVPRCPVFTTLRTGHFDMGSKTDDAGRRDESKRTAIFRTSSVRNRFTACPLYCARRDIPSARNVYAYCSRRQQNIQNTVSAHGRDARIISRQSRNTSSASAGIETVRPYIAANDEAYGTREKTKRPVCSVRFRKTCPKSGTTRLIGKR